MRIKDPRKLLLMFGLGALVAAFISFIGHFAYATVGSSQEVSKLTAIKVNGGYEEALPKDSPAATKYTKIARATGYLERYPQLATSEFTTRDGQKVVKSAAVAFDKMKAAARGDGVSLRILSGFRSISTQVGIFERKIKMLGSAQRAAEFSAPPGHSQHHTGLALDLNSLSPSFRGTKAYRWLKKRAPEFGFMLSYENDENRCDLGPHNEPWHWVYIGEPAAKSLMQDFIDRAMKCGYNPEKP